MYLLKSIFCEHIFVDVVNNTITPEISEQCKIMYSPTTADIYKKFTIPSGNTYQKCIKCDKRK